MVYFNVQLDNGCLLGSNKCSANCCGSSRPMPRLECMLRIFGYDATNHVKPKFACPKVTPLGRKHNKFKLQNLRSALIDHTQQPPQSNCQSLFQMEYFFRGVSRVSAGHPRLPGSPMFHSKILQVHRSTMFKG